MAPSKFLWLNLSAITLWSIQLPLQPASAAATDQPDHSIKTLNTPRQFPAIDSREAWQKRAREIREHILVSCGLWPMPEKTPLNPRIFGKIERDGYSVEKVYLETFPGFYLAGNLYRPIGHGAGPFPGVLNPHGHWKEGRFTDSKDGSVAARCISFARQGMVAFSYDMVGYNDTHFADAPGDKAHYDVHRAFGAKPVDQLWEISLMGLQTWDSIRALDFLESLPDVDKKRLACTGESGGGTQTFMLGAVEDRLAAQAPVVMVSHTMQGGCSCENAPGLRVKYSNMEIAAVPAPRPQILVAATGDWTRATLTVEGPAIAHIYDLFQARDRFDFVRFDFGHNYNQTSREAVYRWFGKWLLHNPDPATLKESSCQKEPDADLRVFPDGKLPEGALTLERFTSSLRKLHQAQWDALVPRNKSGLEKFKRVMFPLWRHSLQLDWPTSIPQVERGVTTARGEFSVSKLNINSPGAEGPVSASFWTPANWQPQRGQKLIIWAAADEQLPAADGPAGPSGLARQLLERGFAILAPTPHSGEATPDQFADFYSTYNRTRLQTRVAHLLTLCASAQVTVAEKHSPFRVVLLGTGPAAVSVLLAAAGADAVAADAGGLDLSDDQALLAPDLFTPGLRNMGTFQGGALLAAPHPLLLHNTGKNFPTTDLRSGYEAVGAAKKLVLESDRVSDDALLQWISSL